MQQQPSILIASSVYDRPCIEHVIALLEARGCKVVLFNSDEVANGTAQFSIYIDRSGEAHIMYQNKKLKPAEIGAAWYRRPNVFGLDETPLRAYSMNREYQDLQRFLWDSIPIKVWLNAPTHMRAHNNKLSQLLLARSLGFAIPETMVSNRWDEVTALKDALLTFKMPSGGVIYNEMGEARTMCSTTLSNNLDTLPTKTLPYPGIWQQHITKRREWRVTVVGKQYFSMAIYTSDQAKDDWRKHQTDHQLVQFVVEPFPDMLGKKCCEFVKRCDLKYGAFDFIEEPDGKIVFLEMNPNGQFLKLEGPTMPVSRAIANELARIANKRR